MNDIKHTSNISSCESCSLRPYALCGAVIDYQSAHPDRRNATAWISHERARARQLLYEKGEPADGVKVICDGYAFQFIQLPDGRRQILSVLLPGDLVSANAVFSRSSHFSVMSLTEVTVARLNADVVREAVMQRTEALDRLARSGLFDLREKEELLVDLGRRTAEERIAHVLLRLVRRLASSRGGTPSNACYPCPLRQQHLADMTGLTSVHVSRVVSAFRKAGVFDLSRSTLTIFDWDRLESIGGLR